MPFGFKAPWSLPDTSGSAKGHHASYSITIQLRIEGENGTLFEGRITTSGHDVTLPNGKTHHADGTTRWKKASYPTPIAALDDAAHLEGFTWDGKYVAEHKGEFQFDGIFITRIGDTEQDMSRFWGIFSKFQPTKVGGCEHRLEAGDDLLFAFNPFNKICLKLSGPVRTSAGVPITVTVINGATDLPMSGVVVGGKKTDANGRATLIFQSPGIHSLKAERSADCVRSNVLHVIVSR